MSVEMLLPAEAAATNLALERFDVSVRHNVKLQLVKPIHNMRL